MYLAACKDVLCTTCKESRKPSPQTRQPPHEPEIQRGQYPLIKEYNTLNL